MFSQEKIEILPRDRGRRFSQKNKKIEDEYTRGWLLVSG
jgi:hypothetical protein